MFKSSGAVSSCSAANNRLAWVAEVRKPERYAADAGASLIDSSHARDVLGWEAEGRWPEIVAKYAP